MTFSNKTIAKIKPFKLRRKITPIINIKKINKSCGKVVPKKVAKIITSACRFNHSLVVNRSNSTIERCVKLLTNVVSILFVIFCWKYTIIFWKK